VSQKGDALPDVLAPSLLRRGTAAVTGPSMQRHSNSRPEAHQGAPIVLQSTLICPTCGHTTEETMPIDACVAEYVCKQCRSQIKARHRLCIFCSYGSVPCPPIREERLGLSMQPHCCRGAAAGDGNA